MPSPSAKTISEYSKFLRYLDDKDVNYKNITNLPKLLEDISQLKTKNGTTIQLTSVKLYFSSILWYLKTNNLPYFTDELSQELCKINGKLKTIIESNTLINSQKENYLEWDKILEIYNNLSKTHDTSQTRHKNYVLLSCYILLPPRRLKDFSLMHITNNLQNLDDCKNYYINQSDCHFFIFQEYKTKNKYKVQKIRVPPPLETIINLYISKYSITDSLFKLSEKNINNRLSRIFIKYANKQISVNILRHSYITYLKKSGKLNDLQIKKTISEIMGHSSTMQDEYYKDKSKEYITLNNRDIIELPNL